MKTIFRTDGNREIGLGHIVRCLALADELKDRNVSSEMLFITKYEEGQRLIECREYKVLRAEHDELSQISQLSTGGALLITDFLDTDNAFISHLKASANITVISIDNNTRLKRIDADVVVNANVFDEEETKVIGSTRYYLGPKYMILRKEFGAGRVQVKEIGDQVRTILVMSGGGDSSQDSLLIKSVSALNGIGEEVRIHLVCGPVFPFTSKLRKLLSEAKGEFDVSFNPPNLIEIMKNADIAISAAGITLYELATLGIPSMVVPQRGPHTNHQEDIAISFEAHGACINLGRNASADLLRQKSIMLMNDRLQREKLSENAKTFVDGRGLERLLQVIESLVEKPN